MIKKLHEEWEKLSQEASQLRAQREGLQDPERHREILDRMGVVGDALRKMSQSSVTRTTLSQAVRDALLEILRTERESCFPEFTELKGELQSLREALSGGMEE